jgi:hypothetical protein
VKSLRCTITGFPFSFLLSDSVNRTSTWRICVSEPSHWQMLLQRERGARLQAPAPGLIQADPERHQAGSAGNAKNGLW